MKTIESSQLQSDWNDSLAEDFLWSNTNVGEAVTQAMTPFTWSVVHELFDHGMGKLDGQSIIGNIAGHPYTKISLVSAMYSRMGMASNRFMESFSELMGTIPDTAVMPEHRLPRIAIIRFVFRYIRVSVWHMFVKRKRLKWLTQDCPNWCEVQSVLLHQSRSEEDLIARYQALKTTSKRAMLLLVQLANQLTLYQQAFIDQLSEKVSPDDLETLRSGLGGNDQLRSMGPILATAALVRGDITRATYVRMCGHRCPEEAEFASPRNAESPDWIERAIENWRDTNVEQLLAQQAAAQEQAWSRVRQKHPIRHFIWNRLFRKMATLAQEREQVRSEMVRIAWVLRQWVLHIAAINDRDDELFFLTSDELMKYLGGDQSVLDIIPTRQQIHRRYVELPPLPNVISGSFDPFRWAEDRDRLADQDNQMSDRSIPADDPIKGFAGAAGSVEGTVRILESYEQMDEFNPGEILVANVTNVGWTPLFPHASAVITNIGAPLSHAAIVARELGIPAVVGTGNATQRLSTGDRVRVDGSAGTVTIVQKSSDLD